MATEVCPNCGGTGENEITGDPCFLCDGEGYIPYELAGQEEDGEED